MEQEFTEQVRKPTDLLGLTYEALFAAVDTPLLVLDKNLTIVAANKAYINATSLSPNAIGKHVFDVFPVNPSDPMASGPGSLKVSLLKVLKHLKPDEMPVVKYDIPVRDSKVEQFEERFWKVINIPVFNNQGAITHILHRAEDVTDVVRAQDQNVKMQLGQKELTALRVAQDALKASQFELNQIVRLTPVSIAVLKGAEHVYTLANPAHEKMVRKSTQGKSVREAYTEEERKNLTEILDHIYKTGEPFFGNELQYSFEGADGVIRKRWLNLSLHPIPARDGSTTGILSVAQDVTEQIQARENLKEAKEEAERANQLKSFFLANMSHEIRTPLGAILGFSRLLKERNLDPNEKDHYVDTIIRNGNALTRIIDDILDLAKVEAGKLDVEKVPFSLYNVVTDAVDLFRDKAKAKNIYLFLNIDDQVPAKICSDPSRLRQILVNLIGNAVKFTDEGGVRVNVNSSMESEQRIKITIDVKDTGIGLTPDQKEKLFKPFTQADNSMTRKFGGTGLGLALSKRLSEALSGKITISECEPGRGCTFNLTFYAQVASDSISQSENKNSNPQKITLKGLRVLVVDDSKDNQFLVARLLAKSGALVETAADGYEGWSKALKTPYDVVLMDIQMPNMDGYQAKKALDDDGYDKPVIALTAHAMAEERVKTTAAGFADHLTKPIVEEELLRTLSSFAPSS